VYGDKPVFDFQPKSHWDIGEKLGILDFQTASKLSGARFSMLRDKGCALERALINFMIDTHREKGYSEVMPPFLVTAQTMQGTGAVAEI